ncbi:MAG: BatD family protein [Cytophagales bacterium]
MEERMRYFINIILLFFLIFFRSFLQAAPGDVRIELGRNSIAQNQVYTIKIILENENFKSYSDFPEIPGFQKRGTSSSTNTTIVNGKMSVSTSITQNYFPTKQGTFSLAPFKMTINGKTVGSKGTKITVGPPVQNQRRRDPFAWDPFDDFFKQGRSNIEYVDVEADAFFAVTTDKKEVYRGEGFNLTVSFFVAEKNKAQMRFPGDIGNQLNEIIKEIKPANVWEENFGISEIIRKPVKLNGKNYDQYILFQSSYFPLNEKDIVIPPTQLRVIKYKEAKTRSFFGSPRQEDEAVFKSKKRRIHVKPLPEHPLKELVSVGNYKLEEDLKGSNLKTGNSFEYTFKILGQGNIAGINDLQAPQDENFDFYSPSVAQNIQRANNSVGGSKSFNFYAIPKEPGAYDLGDYFSWIFFNPKTEKYDTLISDIKIEVTGESQKNSYILSNDMGTFYDLIEFQNNKLQAREESIVPKIIYLSLLSLSLLVSIYVYIKK